MSEAMATQSDSGRVPLGNKLRYGVGMYGYALGHVAVGALSFFFYTEVMGLSSGQAGLIFSLGALADIVAELVMAFVVSRTKGRLGPYRPWLIAGSLPFGLFLALVFVKLDLGLEALFFYALATHVLFRLAFGMVALPYTAMIARLSTDADERASLGAVKGVFNAAGAMTATYLGFALVQRLGDGDDRLGFLLTGIFFGAICTGALLACGLYTREREGVIEKREEVTGPLEGFRLIAGNRPFLLVLVSVLLFFCCYTMTQAGLAYYFKYYLGRPESAGNAFLMIALSGLTTPPLWAKLVHVTSKRFVWIAGCLAVAAAMAILVLADTGAMPLLYAAYLLYGAGNGALVANYAAIAADAIDYGDLKLGRRAEAYSFACLSVSARLSVAVGGALTGAALTAIGFRPGGVAQSAETVAALPLVVCALPGALAIASAIVIAFFPVSTARHRAILDGLAERSRAVAAP